MRFSLRVLVVSGLLLLGCAGVAQSALGAAVDDLGTTAVSTTAGYLSGWPKLIAKAHQEAPSMKLFWPHPTKQAEGWNYVGSYRNDGVETPDEGPKADLYRCADSITGFNMAYHSEKYDTTGVDPNGFNVSVSISKPKPCEWLFDRNTLYDGYQAGIFNKSGGVTLHLRKGVRRNGKLQVERYTAAASIYTDTKGTGEAEGLADCIVITELEGTTVAVTANGGPNKVGASCAKAEEFSSTLDRIRYVSGHAGASVARLAARRAGAKPPNCAQFVSGKEIAETIGEKVDLTKPNPLSAVGAWQFGPRTACFATQPLPAGVTGELPNTLAVWGVGEGVSAAQWSNLVHKEGGPNTIEGTGPWKQQGVKFGGGYKAFFAITEVDVPSGGKPVNFLYVLTPHDDLFYLNIGSATTSQLLGLAKKSLAAHPKF